MKINTEKKGFGVVVVIIIIAILSVGGYTAVKYAQKNKVEMEVTKADALVVAEAKTKVRTGLANLKTVLASNIGLDAKVKATTVAIADLKAVIATANESVGAEAQADLQLLNDQLTQLEVEANSSIETAQNTVSNIIKDIQVSAGINVKSDTTTDDDKSTSNTDVDTDTNEAEPVTVDADVSGSIQFGN